MGRIQPSTRWEEPHLSHGTFLKKIPGIFLGRSVRKGEIGITAIHVIQ